MNILTNDHLEELSHVTEGPCLSLYLPTHRHHPENQQDPIRFRGLLKNLESALQKNHGADAVAPLLKPFEELGQDSAFWNHTLDGLAVFGAPGFFKVITLQRPVQELAVVADSFHTKPLRRMLQSTDRYHILGLSLHEIRLYEGNRDSLDELELQPGVPRTITDALGDELTEPHMTVASYGGTGGRSVAMRHGHGGKKDEADIDEERFFRAVDKAILEHYSRPSGLPLMLAALPEHHGEFHKFTRNPALMTEGLKINPAAISMDELRTRAWEIFEPQYRARLAALTEEFEVAKSKGQGLDDLAQISEAAFSGRVATLIIEADREIAGRIHPGRARLSLDDSDDFQGDDLLDDLGEMVVKQGGQVLVVPAGGMPTETGAAATCRY